MFRIWRQPACFSCAPTTQQQQRRQHQRHPHRPPPRRHRGKHLNEGIGKLVAGAHDGSWQWEAASNTQRRRHPRPAVFWQGMSHRSATCGARNGSMTSFKLFTSSPKSLSPLSMTLSSAPEMFLGLGLAGLPPKGRVPPQAAKGDFV